MLEVKEALRMGFEKAYSIELIRGRLVKEERKLARELYREEYSISECNFLLETIKG